MSWRVRLEGSGNVVELPTAQKVLEGIREGEWEPSDEVRGPIDRDWTPIEEHAQFADVISEMGPPPAEEVDESRLDMNPLIDVALVLLVFFILTTTYSILRRTIDVPGEPEQQKDGQQAKPKPQDVQERMFKVELWMVDERPRLKINDRIIEMEDVEKTLTDTVKATGKREILLEFEGRVPWGVVAKVIDAAKVAEVVNVNLKKKKPG
jgi:biopolymer transport protein ExbD